jgi:hypothetical protein
MPGSFWQQNAMIIHLNNHFMISVINGYAFLFFVEGKVLMTFR